MNDIFTTKLNETLDNYGINCINFDASISSSFDKIETTFLNFRATIVDHNGENKIVKQIYVIHAENEDDLLVEIKKKAELFMERCKVLNWIDERDQL